MADADRLAEIGRFRQAGLALATIRRLLDEDGGGLATALAARLADLNAEIRRLREQQRFIIGVLGRRGERLAYLSRDAFVALLHAGGFTDADMDRWHAAFERSAPEEHQRFLEFLCLPAPTIRRIRAHCRRGAEPRAATAARRG